MITTNSSKKHRITKRFIPGTMGRLLPKKLDRITRQDKGSKSHVLRTWTGQDDGMATFSGDFEL